jgi:hypothetical protein
MEKLRIRLTRRVGVIEFRALEYNNNYLIESSRNGNLASAAIWIKRNYPRFERDNNQPCNYHRPVLQIYFHQIIFHRRNKKKKSLPPIEGLYIILLRFLKRFVSTSFEHKKGLCCLKWCTQSLFISADHRPKSPWARCTKIAPGSLRLQSHKVRYDLRLIRLIQAWNFSIVSLQVIFFILILLALLFF